MPQVLSEYQARWGSARARGQRRRPAADHVHPPRRRGSSTSARAGRSLAGRWVYVQRRSSLGQWVNRKKVRLGSSGARRFKMPTCRAGRHILRIFMTTNQAGTGYLWSHSRTLVVTKR